MRRKTRFVAAVVALSAVIASPFAVYAAGAWWGFQVIGGASYCSGSVGTGTGSTTGQGTAGLTTVCAVTVPAGPTTLLGTEMIPADILNGSTAGSAGPGSSPLQTVPQTAYMPVATAASGAYLITSPTGVVNMTVAVPNGITNVIQQLTGTMTTYALILPTNPYDGQLVRFTANATITTLFVTSTGLNGTSTVTSVDTTTKILGGLVVSGFLATPTQGAVLGGFSYIYNLSNNKWFKLS